MDDQLQRIDQYRREKIFKVARHLKANVYSLEAKWLEDLEKWALVCTAKINGVPYESANFLDDFQPKEHAEIFRLAFSRALQEVQKEEKSELISIH